MSIQHPDSVGKVRKILLFEAVFHDSASDCTKLTLADESKRHHKSFPTVSNRSENQDMWQNECHLLGISSKTRWEKFAPHYAAGSIFL